MTRVPCFSATGEEEAWTEVLWEPSQGTLHHRFHKGRKEWLLLSEDGTVHFVRGSKNGKGCSGWSVRALALHGTTRHRLWYGQKRPASSMLPTRDFSCTGCGAIPVHNLSFIPEPKDRMVDALYSTVSSTSNRSLE